MLETPSKLSGIFAIRDVLGLTRLVQTQDLHEQMSEWQCSSPVPLSVVGMITTYDSRRTLQAWLLRQDHYKPQDARLMQCMIPSDDVLFAVLQAHFASQRVHGDWFHLDDTTLFGIPFEHTAASDSLRSVTREAALVWAGVAHACRQVPSPAQFSSSDYDGKGREAVLSDHIVEWLVSHGTNNIGFIIQFVLEYASLVSITVTAGLSPERYDCDFLEDFVPWLVLQGQENFQLILENPSILEMVTEFRCGRHWPSEALSQIERLPTHSCAEEFNELQEMFIDR